MKHFQQLEELDCGRACLVIATELPFETVSQTVAADVGKTGLTTGEMLHALYKLTGFVWAVKDFSIIQIQLEVFRFSGKCIVGLEREDGSWHWIAADERFIYDPLLPNPIPFDEANNLNWIVRILVFPGLS